MAARGVGGAIVAALVAAFLRCVLGKFKAVYDRNDDVAIATNGLASAAILWLAWWFYDQGYTGPWDVGLLALVAAAGLYYTNRDLIWPRSQE